MKNFFSKAWQKRAEYRSGLLLIFASAFIFAYTFQAPRTLGQIHHNFPLIIRIISGAVLLWGAYQILLVFFPSLRRYHFKRIGRNRVSLPRDGLVYLLIMTILFVGSILSRENMLMLVFAMMIGPFVLNGWITYSMLKNIELKRTIPKRVMAGETFTAEISFENKKRLIAAYLMEVKDYFANRNDRLEASVVFQRVGPRQGLSAHYYAKLMHRGTYEFGPLHVSTRYPLGLVTRGTVFSEYDEIIVHPQIGRLSSHWEEDFFSVAELAQQNQHRRGVFDDEFNHIREYRNGDSQRAIHWRSSARQGELMVREYHQNRNYDLIIGLDLWSPGHTNQDQAERVEWAISFVATLCKEHLKNSRDTSLTLVSQGKTLEVLEVGIGSMGLEYLLDFLAKLEPGNSEPAPEFTPSISQATSSHSRTVIVTTRSESSSPNGDQARTTLEDQQSNRNGQWKTIEADPAIISRWLLLNNA